MKLYLISRKGKVDYDEYNAIVVAAKTMKEAKLIHPNGKNNSGWVNSPDEVKAEYIGMAKKGTKSGVILASYNAG